MDHAKRSALELVATFVPMPLRNLAQLLEVGADIEMTQDHVPSTASCVLAAQSRAGGLLAKVWARANVNGQIESNGRIALKLVCVDNFSSFSLF